MQQSIPSRDDGDVTNHSYYLNCADNPQGAPPNDQELQQSKFFITYDGRKFE
jgi:hypothetical protein